MRFRLLIVLFAGLALGSDARSEGALAFGQFGNGGWAAGTAFNYPTMAEAEAAALARCSAQGAACEIRQAFQEICFAYAVQKHGNGWGGSSAPTEQEARSNALQTCHKHGLRCTVRESGCDTLREVARNVICTRPVFTEERRLRTMLMDHPERAEHVADVINYLTLKYCRVVHEDLEQEGEVGHLGDNCHQQYGTYRGERVYWGGCYE